MDLIRKLCTRAGMIMEDARVEALTISADVSTIHDRLVRLADAAHAISVIVAAAGVLSRFEDIR
jgi:hypothetical protein